MPPTKVPKYNDYLVFFSNQSRHCAVSSEKQMRGGFGISLQTNAKGFLQLAFTIV